MKYKIHKITWNKAFPTQPTGGGAIRKNKYIAFIREEVQSGGALKKQPSPPAGRAGTAGPHSNHLLAGRRPPIFGFGPGPTPFLVIFF